MKIIGNRIMVKMDLKDSIHGIIVPDTIQKSYSREAIVIDPNKTEWLKKDDKIIVNGFSAKEIEIAVGDVVHLIYEEDILCKMVV